MVLNLLIWIVVGLAVLLAGAHLWTRWMATAAERLVPRTGVLQRVGGGVLNFVDSGPRDAPVVVLIHGLSGQLQHFTYSLCGLLETEFRVIAVDRPGCGYSTMDTGDGSPIGDQARMIGELLDSLDIRRAIISGHSLGGAVALRMALDRPGQVAALALLCPLTVKLPETPDELKGLEIRSSGLRRFLGATIAVPIARLTADKILNRIFAPEPCPSDFLERAGGALGLRPQGFVTASADMMAINTDMPAQAARYLGELRTPGGVLFGAEDGALDPDHHGAPMQSLGLEFETLPGRGHMIPITAPDDCATFIRRIADRVGTGGSVSP